LKGRPPKKSSVGTSASNSQRLGAGSWAGRFFFPGMVVLRSFPLAAVLELLAAPAGTKGVPPGLHFVSGQRDQFVEAPLDHIGPAPPPQLAPFGDFVRHLHELLHLPVRVFEEAEAAVGARRGEVGMIERLARPEVIDLATSLAGHPAVLEERFGIDHVAPFRPERSYSSSSAYWGGLLSTCLVTFGNLPLGTLSSTASTLSILAERLSKVRAHTTSISPAGVRSASGSSTPCAPRIRLAGRLETRPPTAL